MNILYSIILGIIEGASEFLPISSTGHLILVSRALGIETAEFVKSFEIAIQLGAIFAALFLYWRKLFFDYEILKKIALAFIPTGIVGLLFYGLIKTVFFENTYIVLAALFFGGIILIAFEILHRGKEYRTKSVSEISPKQAVFVGVAQGVSIIPGVSRAAATILGGLVLGIDRKIIVEFSFMLAIPTMLAATGYDLLKNSTLFSAENFQILAVGFIASFVVAIVAIKFFIRYISNHSFILFGAYRVMLALLFWIIFM